MLLKWGRKSCYWLKLFIQFSQWKIRRSFIYQALQAFWVNFMSLFFLTRFLWATSLLFLSQVDCGKSRSVQKMVDRREAPPTVVENGWTWKRDGNMSSGICLRLALELTVQSDIAIKCSLIKFSIYQWATESTLSRAIITREKKTHQSSREKCSPVHKNTRVNNLDDMHHWTSYRVKAASRSRLLSIMCEFLD